MLGLKPINLLPARERVASELRKAIISKNIKEGELLTLESTASELGVSVTPVREAFHILARDGLIDLKQNKCAVVLGINEETIRDHYQIRAALESEACLLCCRSDADLSRVKNCLDHSEHALAKQDVTEYSNYNQSFHYEIWQAAGNQKLSRMLSELWNGLSVGLEITVKEYAEISFGEHQKIYEQLRNRNGEGAYQEMHRHIYRSMEDMLTRYKE